MEAFANLLDFLLAKEGRAYVLEVESRFHFTRGSQEDPVNSWCSAWSKILFEAQMAFSKKVKHDNAQNEEVLQPPTKVPKVRVTGKHWSW